MDADKIYIEKARPELLNNPRNNSYTVTNLLFLKPSKLDGQNLLDTAEKARTFSYAPRYVVVPVLADQQELIYNNLVRK